MGLLVGLLGVAAMVEVFFFFSFSAVLGGGEWIWWMWMWMQRFLSIVILFSFFVSGGCGMGGGFLVGGWQCGASGIVRKRETEEREEK